MEAIYTASIESRTDEILKGLSLTNSAASNTVHDLIIAQYRVMRSRDDLINAKLEAIGKDINYANRADRARRTNPGSCTIIFSPASRKSCRRDKSRT